jgi:hypothetical protein
VQNTSIVEVHALGDGALVGFGEAVAAAVGAAVAEALAIGLGSVVGAAVGAAVEATVGEATDVFAALLILTFSETDPLRALPT